MAITPDDVLRLLPQSSGYKTSITKTVWFGKDESETLAAVRHNPDHHGDPWQAMVPGLYHTEHKERQDAVNALYRYLYDNE